MDQMEPQVFGWHGVQLQAHEIAGVERIIGPDVITVFTAVQQRLHFVGAAFHNLELFFLLLYELW
ncbi:hypothetical protein D3C74_444950 [compost metagenome]